MNRGEVWRYRPVIERRGQPLLRLVVSGNAFNRSTRLIVGLQLVETDPASLLAVPIGGLGWASTPTIEVVLPSRLDELVGTATPEEMDRVDNVLRAALDL